MVLDDCGEFVQCRWWLIDLLQCRPLEDTQEWFFTMWSTSMTVQEYVFYRRKGYWSTVLNLGNNILLEGISLFQGNSFLDQDVKRKMRIIGIVKFRNYFFLNPSAYAAFRSIAQLFLEESHTFLSGDALISIHTQQKFFCPPYWCQRSTVQSIENLDRGDGMIIMVRKEAACVFGDDVAVRTYESLARLADEIIRIMMYQCYLLL